MFSSAWKVLRIPVLLFISGALSLEEDESRCPYEDLRDWYHHDDACYNFVIKNNNEEKSWWDAYVECGRLGGSLASIHSLEENYWIFQKVKNFDDAALWIGGFYNSEMMGVDGKAFSWIDLTPFDWEYWEDDGLNQYNGTTSCIEFRANQLGHWNKQRCSKKAGYICKKNLEENPSLIPSNSSMLETYCDDGWWPMGNRCIKPFLNKQTYPSAKATCEGFTDGQLVSIHSQEEQDDIAAYLHTLHTTCKADI